MIIIYLFIYIKIPDEDLHKHHLSSSFLHFENSFTFNTLSILQVTSRCHCFIPLTCLRLLHLYLTCLRLLRLYNCLKCLNVSVLQSVHREELK